MNTQIFPDSFIIAQIKHLDIEVNKLSPPNKLIFLQPLLKVFVSESYKIDKKNCHQMFLIIRFISKRKKFDASVILIEKRVKFRTLRSWWHSAYSLILQNP